MAKQAAFGCKSCGDTFLRWSGRCPSCGEMNAVIPLTAAEVEARSAIAGGNGIPLVVTALGTAPPAEAERLRTGIGELDRVLGGGLPPGATVLIGGEPGIGKSTLLAQACGGLAAAGPVLYVTAEEAPEQIRARCARLGIAPAGLFLSAGNDAEAIAATVGGGEYRAAVVDSIQLVSRPGCEGGAGSTAQIRACTALLVEAAKRGRCGLLLVGHVTKDGGLAGPRLLEHLVDTVISFEGDRYQDLRTLRVLKNRFGTTHELGVFTMTPTGLAEVPNPSAIFIADRDAAVPGSCVVPALEGNRCVLVEIQALVNPTELPTPQRRVSGCDAARVAMVCAVLSRRLRLPLGPCDIFVNVTGGARILEPAADLGIALALASAEREVPVPPDLVAVGEVGLGGELRAASRYEIRAAEARRMGFQRLLGPGGGQGSGRIKVKDLAAALAAVGL